MKTTAQKPAKKSLAKNRRGLSSLEYGAMAVAITIAASATWRATGDKVKAAASNSGAQL